MPGRDLSPPEVACPQPATNKGADDSEEDCYNATRGIPPWHQILRQRPGNQPEEYPVQPERQPSFLLKQLERYGTRVVVRPLVAMR